MFALKAKEEKGQAIAEFALIIPFFIMLMLAVVELGWISYQSNMFAHSYSYAAWDITAEKLSDMDPLTSIGSVNTYSGAAVGSLIADTMKESALWGFNSSGLKVSNATAKMYNEESKFMVPGKDSGTSVEATTIRRYMKLEAKIEYNIRPMTVVGNTLFGGMLKQEKDLSYERVVGAQHRSE